MAPRCKREQQPTADPGEPAQGREQAERWCSEVAGTRVHGTTRKLPLVVFQDAERTQLLRYDGVPYDEIASRFHRSPGFIEQVERLARYKIAR